MVHNDPKRTPIPTLLRVLLGVIRHFPPLHLLFYCNRAFAFRYFLLIWGVIWAEICAWQLYGKSRVNFFFANFENVLLKIYGLYLFSVYVYR